MDNNGIDLSEVRKALNLVKALKTSVSETEKIIKTLRKDLKDKRQVEDHRVESIEAGFSMDKDRAEETVTLLETFIENNKPPLPDFGVKMPRSTGQ